MIIKNNKPKAQWFRYKVNGKVAKVYFAAYETVDVQGLTDTSQILSNTYERRIRHIEEAFGYNFATAFEVPGDPDFIAYIIVASNSTPLSGTISPLGSVSVYEKENQSFSMIPTAVSFSISAVTLGNSGGTISPSGATVAPNSHYYLSQLTIDGVNQVTAVTGSVSATSTYTFVDVTSAHTIASVFALAPIATTFTFTPESNYYLNALTENGTDKIGSVVGSVSGVCTYTSSVVAANMAINALFKAYGL